MKPVSLADISYSQALKMLGMRKEALDAGQVQRLPSRVLSNSYFIRDSGQEVEKRSFDFMKTLQDAWATPTGKATAIGTGLGALGGLGKSYMDDEDDNYFGNAVTGALGGGALGLGAGLAFDSGTRNKLVNKATNYINSFGEGGGPEASGQAKPTRRPSVAEEAKSRADAIPRNEMAQEQQALASTRGVDALKGNANLIANTAAAGAAGAGAGKYIPPSYAMDPMERMLTNPADMDWNALAQKRNLSPTLNKAIEQQMAQVPGAGTKVKINTPSLLDVLPEGDGPLGQNSPMGSLKPEVIRGKPIPGDVQGMLDKAILDAGGNLPKGTTAEAAAAYRALLDGGATPGELRQIGKELGINPAFLSGGVENPAALKSLNRGKAGEGLETVMKPQIGRAIAEGVEQKSLKPLIQTLKRAPKGKLAAILAAAGLGYGALRGTAGGALNEISREGQTRQALREELRKRLSAGGN